MKIPHFKINIFLLLFLYFFKLLNASLLTAQQHRMLLTAALGWLKTRPYHPTSSQSDKVLTQADKGSKKKKD